MSTPEPNDPNLADEAQRVATEAVNAVDAFAKAAVTLPADTLRLGIDTLRAAVQKVEDLIVKATGQ